MDEQTLTSRRIGSTRLSHDGQTAYAQVTAPLHASSGTDGIYIDTLDGTILHRPTLMQAIDHLKPSGTLVIDRFDRVNGDEQGLFNFQQQLKAMSVTPVAADDLETNGGRHDA